MDAAIAASSTEPHLVDGLDFRLPPTGQYIESKRQVTWQPASANNFSPNGARLVRFQLAGHDWLLGETVRVSWQVNNTDAGANRNLMPLSIYGGAMISRARLIVNSQIVEDLQYYNRTNELLSYLLSPGRRNLNTGEGFGNNNAADWNAVITPEPIAPSTGRRVTFPLLFGLFAQPKWLPMSYMNNLTIELELGDADGWIDSAAGNSTGWNITDVRMFADVVTLDPGLTNAISEHVLAGKSLPIAYSSFFTQMNTNPGNNPTFMTSLTKGYSYLKGVLVTFFCPSGEGGVPANTNKKALNHFWSWGSATADLNPAHDRFDVFLSIGNKIMPEYHVTSFSEAWYRLRLAVGKYASDSMISVTPREFRSSKFILAWDTERGALQAGGGLAHTGISTTGGEMLTLQAKGMSANGATLGPTYVYTTLHYDGILQLQLDSASILS